MTVMIFVYSLFMPFTITAAEDAKEQITKRLQELTDSVNQNKLDVLSSFWTQDATIVNPVTKEQVKGKEEIAKYLQKRVAEIKERGLKLNFKPLKISLDKPNEASVEGIVVIDGREGLLQRNARKIGMINQGGQWYIKDMREIEIAPAPPVSSELEQLGWLIGNWKDSDQDVTITFSNQWDRFKNFIIQRFVMEVYGSEAIEGTQVIGWDPITESIVSWVFDSDGGYGNGKWLKKDNSWVVTIHYVLSDGSEGGATNIYSNISDKQYTYSSINRSIGNEPLDDIKPVTIVKE